MILRAQTFTRRFAWRQVHGTNWISLSLQNVAEASTDGRKSEIAQLGRRFHASDLAEIVLSNH